MRKIETGTLSILIGTRLFNMCSKHLTQCFLKQMRCRVVLAGSCAECFIHRKLCLITGLHHSSDHFSDMSDFATK